MIEITQIKMTKIESQNNVKAVASIVINDCFAVNDIRLMEGQNGLFIVMPSRKTPNGVYKDIAHPINKETREFIQNKLIEEYKK